MTRSRGVDAGHGDGGVLATGGLSRGRGAGRAGRLVLSDPDAWANARRVLCVRLDTMGDVLMTGPAMRAVSAGGTREVIVLTSPAGAEAARMLPEAHDVLVYEAPWMKATAPRADGRLDRAMADRIRRARFDAAVIFTVYTQSPLPAALLCHLADVPLRLAHCRENPYQLLTDWVEDPEPGNGVRHEVLRHLDLVAAVGMTTDDDRLRVHVPDEARVRALGVLVAGGIDPERPWLVLHPGASAPSRRYPAEGFVEVARRLVDAGCQIVLTGREEERPLVDGIRAGMGAPALTLAGLLDLEELAALLEVAPLLVANNTGPVHLAAAVGTPVVDLYALTNPQHAPWGVPSRVLYHDVPCRFCYSSVCPERHHDCLRLVPPDAVVSAARELLAGRWPDLASRALTR